MIIDAGVNDSLDITSAAMLAALVEQLHSADIDFALAEVRHHATSVAYRAHLPDLIGEDRVFDTLDEAVTTLAR